MGLKASVRIRGKAVSVDDIEAARGAAQHCPGGPAYGPLRIGASCEMRWAASWSGLIDDIRLNNPVVSP